VIVRNLHELAEARSLAIHRLVAERLREDPGLVEPARVRVAAWLADGSVHRAYAEAWRGLLSGPLARLLEVLVDPGEGARALRQCSPFAGVIDPRTRWRIWREVLERFAS
jgi:hypothetical protein